MHAEKFRVREGSSVELKRWPTIIDPVYRSDDDYTAMLSRRVAELSAQQEMLYASNRYALLLIFQAMDAAG